MSANDMFQSFFDEVLKPAITQAVTKAVKDTMLSHNKDLITVAEAAKILKVSKKTIYRYMKEGPVEDRLHFTQPDGKLLLDRHEVETYCRRGACIRIKNSRRK